MANALNELELCTECSFDDGLRTCPVHGTTDLTTLVQVKAYRRAHEIVKKELAGHVLGYAVLEKITLMLAKAIQEAEQGLKGWQR